MTSVCVPFVLYCCLIISSCGTPILRKTDMTGTCSVPSVDVRAAALDALRKAGFTITTNDVGNGLIIAEMSVRPITMSGDTITVSARQVRQTAIWTIKDTGGGSWQSSFNLRTNEKSQYVTGNDLPKTYAPYWSVRTPLTEICPEFFGD
jgi:hypothetical protein